MRGSLPHVGSSVVDVLRSRPADEVVSLRLATSSLRGRWHLAEQLRLHAQSADCCLAVAETSGVAVRWVDGIVRGRAEDLVRFLTAAEPVLSRARGRCVLAAAA
ncbi:MAG: hypothetical protein ACRDV2_09985 [Actinomycetes bacterium]